MKVNEIVQDNWHEFPVFTQANDHLEHPEDEILNKGFKGARHVLQTLKNLSTENLKLKWDGSPSIVFGVNPLNQRFFVGTKSVFSKKYPKINYTHSDIDYNHEGDLARKLKYCLDYLPEISQNGIYQADLIFTKDDIKDDVNYLTCQPNTVVYAFPKYSEITNKNLGIVIHTEYSINENMLFKKPFSNTLTNTKNVWIGTQDNVHIHENAYYYIHEYENILSKVPKVIWRLLHENPCNFSKYLKRFFNCCVRNNSFELNARDFIEFYKQTRLNDIDRLKSEKGRKNREKQVQNEINTLIQNENDIEQLIKLYQILHSIKQKLLKNLNTKCNIQTFVRKNGKLQKTKHEGFVLNHDIKLVDRFEFSRFNFGDY